MKPKATPEDLRSIRERMRQRDRELVEVFRGLNAKPRSDFWGGLARVLGPVLVFLSLLALLGLGLLSCSSGGGGGSSAPAEPAPVDLEGDWEGAWASSTLPAAGDLDLSLIWDSVLEEAVGGGRVSGSPCFSNVEARFVVAGRRVEGFLSPPTALYDLFVAGEVSQDSRSVTGSYAVLGGSMCLGDSGSFRMDRL